ncbi:aminodeoxychorismate lyase [Psychromonas sp. Urea-02u-13]|uniref:aminodeoxychorismate lyase n=1 Tax=Psychromonas sp. Urea-02u-13 TaxID=2058326 RepID=UPI000C326B7E|nr:aminodeoxychorismate lyase [Psychromonas sp. Urea-02u-13]PKG38687.1 aminodeoxychorismate lyase [Psychromonas sp. Urea-02u-13]
MLINGIKSNQINALDRGLAYGDGLFTTINVEFGVAQLWDFHLQRLTLGAQKLFFPDIDWQQLSTEVIQTAALFAAEPNHVLKVILTRGSGGRGYSAKGCDSVMRIISNGTYPEFYFDWQKKGIDVILCESTLSSNKQLAGLKTLNRLDQVLIKNELESKQAVEGLVCDDNGYVIEACTANIFIYLDGIWQTPILDKSGVAGVQRRNIMSRAKATGIDIIESYIHQDKLSEATAICLTNALMGVVPVKRYQDKVLNLERSRMLQLLINIGSNKK